MNSPSHQKAEAPSYCDSDPILIQGGMGVGVSGWRLANAVARTGHLGVVSGTSLDTVLVRRLQDGDADGHVRRALAAFPCQDSARAIVGRWWRPSGRASDRPYDLLPMPRLDEKPWRLRLVVAAAFVEVWLAREGHAAPIGINLLTKIRIPTLPTLYGAMLAGAAWVLMGAGIPKFVPTEMTRLAQHRDASLPLDVAGATRAWAAPFRPSALFPSLKNALTVPRFLAIVSSHSLATMLTRKGDEVVHGFVVEGPSAGGHNAPPRGSPQHNSRGEPCYGRRDEVDHGAMRALGRPFWLAGGYGRRDGLQRAQSLGARGIQVGSLFAFCMESGIATPHRRAILSAIKGGRLDVFTDPRASPTGYPFKILRGPGIPEQPENRIRRCDLGYLRECYERPDGQIGYRCPGEPEDAWVRKGGRPEDCLGRRCLCNGLIANIGHPQPRAESDESPLLTAGDDIHQIAELLNGRDDYSAADVVEYLSRETPFPGTAQ